MDIWERECREGTNMYKGNECMINMDLWKRRIFHANSLAFIKTSDQIINYHYPQNLMGNTKLWLIKSSLFEENYMD